VYSVGHALWLTHFTPARRDHLGFVNLLLKEFCSLDICCALVGTYPVYIAGVLSSHYVDQLRLSQVLLPELTPPLSITSIENFLISISDLTNSTYMQKMMNIRVSPVIPYMKLHMTV